MFEGISKQKKQFCMGRWLYQGFTVKRKERKAESSKAGGERN
jgi:hypothetical protein